MYHVFPIIAPENVSTRPCSLFYVARYLKQNNQQYRLSKISFKYTYQIGSSGDVIYHLYSGIHLITDLARHIVTKQLSDLALIHIRQLICLV